MAEDKSGPLFLDLEEMTPEELSRCSELPTKAQRSRAVREGTTKILASRERSWLQKHGKKQYIDFDTATRRQLHDYFNAIDEDGSGFITIDELLDPLVAFGLAETRDEVKQLFDIVDTDKSNKIEFEEFLAILKCGDASSPMAAFFKDMASGRLIPFANNLPFNLVVSNYRRKMLLDGVIRNDPRGEKVAKAYSRIRQESQAS